MPIAHALSPFAQSTEAPRENGWNGSLGVQLAESSACCQTEMQILNATQFHEVKKQKRKEKPKKKIQKVQAPTSLFNDDYIKVEFLACIVALVSRPLPPASATISTQKMCCNQNVRGDQCEESARSGRLTTERHIQKIPNVPSSAKTAGDGFLANGSLAFLDFITTEHFLPIGGNADNWN